MNETLIETAAIDALEKLLASDDEKMRFKAAAKLLDYAYSRYEQDRYLLIEERRIAEAKAKEQT